jgi:hypothetical protein
LSEGRLRYETVEKTPEGLQARLIQREGPTGLIMTTTAVSMHPENETRQLTIPLSDTPDQTRRVFRAIAAQHVTHDDQQQSSEAMVEWQALQNWLEYGIHEVVIPYAPALAELIPPVAVRLRRDFTAVLSLIEAHAILHQRNRKKDENGRIVATLNDYQVVRELLNATISQGVEQTVSKTVLETVTAVMEICTHKESVTRNPSEPAFTTIAELAKQLRIDRSAASRRVKQAIKSGYLRNLENKEGQPHRLVIGDSLPEQGSVMPVAEKVREQWKTMR